MGVDPKTGQAVVCSLSAMALFGFVDNFIRLAADAGSLWQFHFIRSLIALAIIGSVSLALQQTLRMKRPRFVFGRTAFSATAMIIYFGCLGVMPIANAVAGLFTAPVFVVIFSVLFFGETVGVRRIFAVLIGFMGILLVLRPDSSDLGAITLLPLIAGAFHALGNITTRRWCADESTLSLLAVFFVAMGTIGVVGLLAMPLAVPNPPGGADGYLFRGWVSFEGPFMWVTVLQGVASLVGVGLIIRSYQLADSSFIAVFENAMIVFATLWAAVLWAEIPDATAVLGLTLIVLSGIIISVRSSTPVSRRT